MHKHWKLRNLYLVRGELLNKHCCPIQSQSYFGQGSTFQTTEAFLSRQNWILTCCPVWHEQGTLEQTDQPWLGAVQIVRGLADMPGDRDTSLDTYLWRARWGDTLALNWCAAHRKQMGVERKSRAQTHHIPLVKVTDYQKTVFSMEVTPLPSGTKTFSCFCQKSMKVATAFPPLNPIKSEGVTGSCD